MKTKYWLLLVALAVAGGAVFLAFSSQPAAAGCITIGGKTVCGDDISANPGPPACTDAASCGSSDDGDDNEPPPSDDQSDDPEPEAQAPQPTPQPAEPVPQAPVSPPQPAPQPQPATPATPAPAETGPQAPVPQPAAPETPAPAKPTPQAPAAPAGPPSYPEILIRDFSGDWTGGTFTFNWYVSHSGGCTLTYPGGHLSIDIDRTPSDNSQPDSRVVSNVSPKGGEATIVCRGIAPDPATAQKEIAIRAAPVSTTKVTVTVQVKSKKNGLKLKSKKPKTVKATVPVAPPAVSGSYQGWCGIRPDGTWGFSQAPFPGAKPALYKPGVGLNCDVGRYTRAEWKAYICKYFHCQDPTRRKK